MAGLLDLPDEILIQILLNLSHCQILSVADIHPRLMCLLANSALWSNINFSRPVSAKILRKCVKYLSSLTKSIRITGYYGGKRPKLENNISDSFFATLKLKCPSLSRLSLHNVCLQQPIRTDTFLKIIPDSVEELELSNCHLPYTPTREKNFTHTLHRTNITKLYLTKCKWLVCKDLIDAMCSAKLKVLRIDGCSNFTNVAHSVCIKTPRQLASQRHHDSELLDLSLMNCDLKQELIRCLLTLNAARIQRLVFTGNKKIKVKTLFLPPPNFKNLKYLDVRNSADVDPSFYQELRAALPLCEIVA